MQGIPDSHIFPTRVGIGRIGSTNIGYQMKWTPIDVDELPE